MEENFDFRYTLRNARKVIYVEETAMIEFLFEVLPNIRGLGIVIENERESEFYRSTFMCRFRRLNIFSEGGSVALAVENDRVAEEKRLQEWTKSEAYVRSLLGSNFDRVSSVVLQQIIGVGVQSDNWTGFDALKVVSTELVVGIGERWIVDSSCGTAKFSRIWAWYKNQSHLVEWQFRDAYNPNQDRPGLRVTGIDSADFSTQDGRLQVRVHVHLASSCHPRNKVTMVFDEEDAE